MKSTLISLCLLVSSLSLFSSITVADTGIITVKSAHNVKDTADKLEAILKKKGMTVFTRIDHSAGAKKVGKTLAPTELIIFGNPKIGTPLMNCARSIAIDLPLKGLIWEDADKTVWLSYNDPAYLAKRHNVAGCDAFFKKMTGALANFSKAATAP